MSNGYFKEEEVAGLNPVLVRMLNRARTFAGIPFIVTSGLRTPEKNAEVGGKEDSAHLTGLACDIQCTNNEERANIMKGAIFAGFKRIGIGKGHIHLDIDHEKPYPRIFIEE
ncbi:MAG: D-Ala-D-Ala carboxypeptidase family metallohydrolase [Bacteroidota bacterium]